MKVNMNFKADEVFTDYNQDYILNCIFSGTIDGQKNYLMIQDAYDREDEQEINLGMDTFYIETQDQSRGGYGGIKEIELGRDYLHIELNEIGKKNLKLTNSTLKISFDINHKSILNLKEKLNEIFEPEKDVKITYNAEVP